MYVFLLGECNGDGCDADGGAGGVLLAKLGGRQPRSVVRAAIELLDRRAADAPPTTTPPPENARASVNASFAPDPTLARQWERLMRSVDGAGGERGGAPLGEPGRPPRGPRRVAVSTRELRGATRARDPRGEYKLVFLPGLYKVAKLLNGTTGVRAVTSSRISRALAAPPDLITDDDAQLSIAINGTGRRGAHRLCASGGAGWRDKTQQLYVECEGGFDEHNLREVLRALSLVLHFELLPGETPPADA